MLLLLSIVLLLLLLPILLLLLITPIAMLVFPISLRSISATIAAAPHIIHTLDENNFNTTATPL
jgi:hypothetical protein